MEISRGNFKGWDISVEFGDARAGSFCKMMLDSRCQPLKIEHKADRKTQTTGNVFVEFAYKGRPSGIEATKSNVYALEYAFERWNVLSTSTLHALCRQLIRNGGRIVKGGDDGHADGLLVPLGEFLKTF